MGAGCVAVGVGDGFSDPACRRIGDVDRHLCLVQTLRGTQFNGDNPGKSSRARTGGRCNRSLTAGAEPRENGREIEVAVG